MAREAAGIVGTGLGLAGAGERLRGKGLRVDAELMHGHLSSQCPCVQLLAADLFLQRVIAGSNAVCYDKMLQGER